MFLEKVLDLDKVKLGPNAALVELVEKKSKIILAGQDGPSSALDRAIVVKSTIEGINEGDHILDARYGQGGNIEFHSLGDRKFTITTAHDIKMWTTEENYEPIKEVE